MNSSTFDDVGASVDGGWISVKKPKVTKMSSKRARDIGTSSGVRGLTSTLLSVEAAELQNKGWYYVKVIRKEEGIEIAIPEATNECEYTGLTIKNQWSDVVLYRRDKAN